MDDHSCPNGPPVPSGSPPWDGSAPSEPRLQVTVIDSGWIVSAVGWLLAFASTEQAETLADGQWKPGSPDAIVVPGTQQLPALTGHAGFIGGVIASRCTHAQITVRNHNGVFDRASDDFPTEAAVARSLYRSAGAQVVNVGFAFRAFSDVISRVWEVSLRRVGETTPVVAPAGNQDDSGPRYPAALHLTHKNVIGVSSIHAAAGQLPAKSDFSNYGPWVTCAAGGENIQSWFPLAIDVVPEEAPGGGKKHFGGWATWNGTSFATPRVVAAIANGIVSGLAPTKAWAALTKPAEKDPDLGYVLESLP